MSWADPAYLDGRHPLEVLVENQTYCTRWPARSAAERREHPGDDLISGLVNAEVDGDRLTDAEVAAFFVLLSVAANDTTRQTTSHAMKALTDFATRGRGCSRISTTGSARPSRSSSVGPARS